MFSDRSQKKIGLVSQDEKKKLDTYKTFKYFAVKFKPAIGFCIMEHWDWDVPVPTKKNVHT